MKTRRSNAAFVSWTAAAVAILAGCGALPDSETSADRSQEIAAVAASQAESDGVAFDPVSMPAESPTSLAAFADDKENPDPIPEEPRPSDLALVLQEFLEFPASAPFPATTDPRLVRHPPLNFLTAIGRAHGR